MAQRVIYENQSRSLKKKKEKERKKREGRVGNLPGNVFILDLQPSLKQMLCNQSLTQALALHKEESNVRAYTIIYIKINIKFNRGSPDYEPRQERKSPSPTLISLPCTWITESRHTFILNHKDIFLRCWFQKVLQVFIEPFNFSFFSITGQGIDLNYCDIEWLYKGLECKSRKLRDTWSNK